MLRHIVSGRALAAAAMAIALAAPMAAAQERGEEIIGTINSVSGRSIAVKHQDGRDIRINVAPSTEVYFQDSGDRKLFPNPGIDDLRAGMGVRFVYNDGNPTRVTVHFVPAGFQRGQATPAPGIPESGSTGGSEQLKVRIKSIDRGGREMTVDVAGRERRYTVDRGEAGRFQEGDLVLITTNGRTVTRIDSADEGGTITRIGLRGRSVTINVDGREETYDVERDGILDDYREGDRVTFEVEDRRNGRKVITAMERRGRGRR
jgi:hypothetical protein